MTTTATPAGTVTLVGAGPGDAGLLTLRGLRALERADVIVADRLGARSVLAQLEAEGAVIAAEVIDVGKLPGHHRVPQDAINELLVDLAALQPHDVAAARSSCSARPWACASRSCPG